jgi:hypothetical protein
VDKQGIKKMKNHPFWFPKKNNVIWYIFFIGLFLLSMDFWGWNQSKPLIFGLPLWIVYLLILTLSTSIIFYLFSKTYWEDSL